MLLSNKVKLERLTVKLGLTFSNISGQARPDTEQTKISAFPFLRLTVRLGLTVIYYSNISSSTAWYWINENLVNNFSSSLPNRMVPYTSSKKLSLNADIRNLAIFWCLCRGYICAHLLMKKILNDLKYSANVVTSLLPTNSDHVIIHLGC